MLKHKLLVQVISITIIVGCPKYDYYVKETHPQAHVVEIENKTVWARVKKNVWNTIVYELRRNGFNPSNALVATIVNQISGSQFHSGLKHIVQPDELFCFRIPSILLVDGEPYYKKTSKRYGRPGLQEILQNIRWRIPYNSGVFDCSNMSSYIEWYLEQHGYETDIVYNPSHAWVMVKIGPGHWIPVECVGNPPYIKEDSEHFKFSGRYKNIYEAIKYSSDEYKWWGR